jgi:ABC-2 type transport system ATP-binding protein
MEVKCLKRDYGNGKGVFDLSFSVERGEVFGFLGPNGAGKTTTIRHLMGFLKPESGTCRIDGKDCWLDRPSVQKNLGYIPGEMNFFDDMTGAEFLNFIEKYRGVDSSIRKMDLISLFELDAKGKLKKMSKGMKQKVGIVAAFMHDPDILILDEPTSGLDPLMQNRFIDLVAEEREKGKTILMSSHMFDEVERACQRVCIIKNGRLAAVDSVDGLKAAQVKKYEVTLESEEAALEFANEDLAISEISHAHVTVLVQNNISQFIALMNKHPIVNISAPSQSLEEIFLQYYGGEKGV